ncbi:phage tail tape measure protein [Nesterenkonia sp. CF4.4]|uniref:phage tail tape measure protein n=1 Tax=Nesterenkonia sp. CF4.4 TaxID=3373079 RepID=UPI003EE4F70D
MAGNLDLGTLRGHVELDVAAFDRKYAAVMKAMEILAKMQDPSFSVDADITDASRRIAEIQEALQSVDGDTGEVSVTGDVSRAEAELGTAEQALTALDGETGEVTVTGDASRAESQLGVAEQALRSLDGQTAEMTLDADTSPAESAISGLGAEGEQAGDDAGQGLSKGVIAALATIPIAGAVVGIGAAIGGALINGIQEGLAVEVSRDMFSARTGLDEATAQRFGLAAGNAYASAFGESTEANLDTARHALQQGLIDEDATQEQITAVISQLTGISDVFEYDIPESARAVGQMLKTGLVSDAEEAFDLIAATSQGAVSDDLMDTLNEYSGQFEQVGLDGADAMGLIRQALDEGARDTDKVADAVKEMGLRVREGTDPAREALANLGVDVEGVVSGFQEGGPAARDAMGIVFDALRKTKDEGGNTQEAIANLFGGPGEDLGAALFALDLGTVQDALGDTEGKIKDVLQTLGDNAATDIAAAKASIETGVEGIQGALAAAFSDDISGAADWVAANRGPLMEFFQEAANGALDLADMGLEAAASMTEGFTGFVSGVLPPFLDGLGNAAIGMAAITGNAELAGAGGALKLAAEGARELGENGQEAADDIRSISGGLDDIRTKMNDEFDPLVMSAKVHDSVTEMTGRLGELETVIDETEGDVTINGDTLSAEDAMTALMGMIDEETGEVTIDGQTYQADEALGALMGAVSESEGDVTISATRAPANEVLSGLLTSVENSWENVSIGGNKVPADEVLQSLRGQIRNSSDRVTIGGNDYPAKTVLDKVLWAVRNGKENITIDGNTYPATVAKDRLLGSVNASGATIDVDAATWDAESAINTAARNRDSYITVHTIGALTAGPGGRTNGGVTKKDGGPIVGPGTGTSDDVPIMASNGEYMMRTAAVEKYGVGLFDRINALHLEEGGPVSQSQMIPPQAYTAPMSTASTAPAPQASAAGGGEGFSIDYPRLASAMVAAVQAAPVHASVKLDGHVIAKSVKRAQVAERQG